MAKSRIPPEAIIQLRQKLEQQPAYSSERRELIQETAHTYGVSEDTIYRVLRERKTVRSVRRVDCGQPRVMPKTTLERYCEVIAALKVRTSNKKGRHLSTSRAIQLLEEEGINTPDGYLQAPSGLLKKSTVNRYLKKWGYDRNTLLRQPPAVRFEAESSNQCWHFDLSPSDLKHVKAPAWIEPGRGKPLLMLYSVVDDRSGVSYQEYHGVYGEDVEAALRFLFNAMSAKETESFPFSGIPEMIYMDNGPITRSSIFQKVMGYLGVEICTHLPQGKDGRRVTARSKGKVERPFRTVKEMHETLYHLHAPETEAEANEGLMRFLLHYNSKPHRSKAHSRLKNDLKRPALEEIGGRTNAFALEGIRGHQEEYIEWVLKRATKNKLQPTEILTQEAITFLGERLSTPLQIEQYLTLAMTEAYQVGVKPITAEFMETVLAIGLDDLEPSLIRHGYNAKTLAELLNVRTSEVRSFLHGQLPPGRTTDMREQMLKIGIPL